MKTKVIGLEVRHSPYTVEIPFNESDSVLRNEEVIFRDQDGKEEYGVVKYVDRDCYDKDKVVFEGKILRRATEGDIQKLEGYGVEGEKAVEKAKEIIAKYEVDMQLFAACYSFDGSRLYFLFTADERVDFRELVKELAAVFKKQINLRQIGPRDRAKLIGGYGKCGRELCCTTFLSKLTSVNMEMVRVQGLENKGSGKLSGSCGKLLCCLKYEVSSYRDLKKILPNIGDIVKLKKRSDGKVIALDILNQKFKVIFKDAEPAVLGPEELIK